MGGGYYIANWRKSNPEASLRGTNPGLLKGSGARCQNITELSHRRPHCLATHCNLLQFIRTEFEDGLINCRTWCVSVRYRKCRYYMDGQQSTSLGFWLAETLARGTRPAPLSCCGPGVAVRIPAASYYWNQREAA
ncbi:hypothetical protein AV530_011882 [Patagioenas fasciata monilis]|uniref:Uncharacterized protein n=1 Tax=Patagioenas fasciata monilis TaxID=372326 RepID=A0A1V4JU40_PATFA|nr:hypothetical protein AV530_011882 [Patagioenas fasciata monilis]